MKKIRSIEIQGNRYVSKNEIREKIKLSKGDLLTEQALKEDIENIVSLGFFLEVNAETVEVEKGVKLIFNVKEKPQIKKIVFRGNKHFSDR
ncbi:MAG TPA: outer membrane protein assembly factor BamA, partial [Elusimicrobia bacterium]|nr:outer membrane protein assembly factor BamA [Elusimicrobiota bacterium]